MKVFIWQYVSQVSSNYHSGGGLVVFADNETRAREIANSDPDVHVADSDIPDEVRSVYGGQEAMFIMPDAGCC